MQTKSNIGLLGFGNANAALAYKLYRDNNVKVWALPNHPGALKSVRTNGGVFVAYGKDIKGNEEFPVNEADSLEELITFSDLLILAVPADAQQAFVNELGKFDSLLQDKILLVINGTGFSIRHVFDVTVGLLLETNNSPTASGLNADSNAVYIKDMKQEMEVSCMRWLGNRAEGNLDKLPYETLRPLPGQIVSMLNACFGLEILPCTPLEIASSGIITSLHGVPVAYNLEYIAEYDDYAAGGREGIAPSPLPHTLRFYRDWAAKHDEDINLFEEQRMTSAKRLGLERKRPLLEVLNKSYGWDFKDLHSLVVAPTCYNEQSLIPETLSHRFVTEGYIGFTLQAVFDKFSGIDASLAAGYAAKFVEFAQTHNRKAFEAHGADLNWLTRAHLVQFGAKFPSPLPLPPGRRIESFDDINVYGNREKPVAALCSGGLDSTYSLWWLHKLGFDVHMVVVNVGGHIDEKALEKIAAKFNATLKILDGRKLFADNLKLAIRAHAMPGGLYPLSSSVSRPGIAQEGVAYAEEIGAGMLVHTANLSQNSYLRLNNGIEQNGFTGAYGSPYIRSTVSRDEKAKALVAAGFPAMAEREVSGDDNFWGNEFEGGRPLDDPENILLPENTWVRTRGGKIYPPETLELGFEDGDLVSVNGDTLTLMDAIQLLNKIVGKFGHERFFGLEPISTGETVLEAREVPGVIAMWARRHLETATSDPAALRKKQKHEIDWTAEALSGNWGSKIHAMSGAAIAVFLKGVTGTVSYKIDDRRCQLSSIKAKTPRYIRNRDEWESKAAHRRAAGY